TEQPFLLAGQAGGDPDPHADDQIAPATALQPREAAATQAQQVSGLRAGRHPDPGGAVHRRDLELRAEGGLREGQVELVDQVGAVADEALVLLDLHDGDDVAARPTSRPGVPLAPQGNVVARRDAWRDVDVDRTRPALDALARA